MPIYSPGVCFTWSTHKRENSRDLGLGRRVILSWIFKK